MIFQKPIRSSFIVIWLVVESFGLTNGPVQPEFSSFEPVDVTDLVNLPTGDFTYVIPLGDVKGPSDVGYPLVLSYHAGVMNEQEATWVGLGWALNVGAISRVVRGFPDDYSGDRIDAYLNDNGETGWSFNIGGGWGPIAGTVGWSDKGFMGITEISIGMNYNVGSAKAGVGLNMYPANNAASISASIGNATSHAAMGIAFGEDMKPSWFSGVGLSTPEGFSLANFSISTKGGLGYSVGGGNSSGQTFTKEGLYQWSGSSGITVPLPYGFRFDLSSSWWGWCFSQLTFERGWGFLYQSPNMLYQMETNNPVLEAYMPDDVWKYALAGGSGSAIPALNGGKNTKDKLEYSGGKINSTLNNDEPTAFNLPSQDIYHVAGQGITGTFKPMVYKAMKTLSASGEYDGLFGEPNGSGNVTTYFNNEQMRITPKYKDGIVFKMMNETSLNQIDYLGTDAEFSYAGKNSYQNIDVDDGTPAKPNHTTGTRIEPLFNLNPGFPARLNGFAITDQEGKTYWYTFPLYSMNQLSYVNNQPTKPSGELKAGGDCSFRKENGQYATMWLLTAITGPDYIKKVFNEDWDEPLERIRPHQGDWGYWVNFRYEYGPEIELNGGIPTLKTVNDSEDDEEPAFNAAAKATYGWRDPYFDSETEAQYGVQYHKEDPCNNRGARYTSTAGIKEITYLKSVETPSEIAYFRTSERLDGIGISSEEYPRFSDAIDANYVSGFESSNTYYQPADMHYARRLADIVPNATSVTSLSQCMKLEFPANLYARDKFDNLSRGDFIANLNFAGNMRMVTASGKKQHRRDARGNIIVMWDDYGWDKVNKQWDESKKGSASPEAMEAKRIPGFQGSQIRTQALWGEWYHWVNYAKCFHMEIDPGRNPSSPDDDKIVLYVIGYSYDAGCTGWDDDCVQRTSYLMADKYYQTYKWRLYHLYAITDIKCTGGVLLLDAQDVITNRKFARYTKKLDEIAWYSKSEFPFLTPYTDPGMEGAMQEFNWADKFPYPQSYRRVKFRYNYELAPGTPNSIDQKTKLRGGGRLTLKEVRTEAGPEDASVAMPPYLFEYYSKDASGNPYRYEGFEKADVWGYRKTTSNPDPQFNDPNLGVCWNLKKVIFPSCGNMSVEYERDFVKSAYSTLYRIRKENECKTERAWGSDGLIILEDRPAPYLENNTNSYYWRGDITSYTSGMSSFRVQMRNAGEIPKTGLYFIVHFYNDTHWPDEADESTYYTFRIENVTLVADRTFDITFNGPIDETGSAPSFQHREMLILKPDNLYCDGIRTKAITTKSLNSVYKTIYQYPSDGGTLELLPVSVIPENFNFGRYVILIGGGGSKKFLKKVQRRPFSADVIENYNTGNVSVIYPFVEVYQAKLNASGNPVTDGTGNIVKVAGSTKYHFWTINDKVTLAGDPTPKEIISYEIVNATVPTDVIVKKVVDRSAIVGLPKKTTIYNNNGDIVSETENTYSFSENLSESAAPFNKPGVLYKDMDNRLGSDKPLGLVRERAVRMYKSGSTYGTSSVMDVTVSKPFLVKTVQKLKNVISTTERGLFDGRTGSPLATLTKGSGRSKLEISIPYIYMLDEASDATLNDIEVKNNYGLRGTMIVAEHTALPKTIKDFIDNYGNKIKGASSQTHYKETASASGSISFNQTRFWTNRNYSWKGNTFELPNIDTSDWVKKSEVGRVDDYSRPVTEKNAAQTSYSVIYHPITSRVLAKVENATRRNVGSTTFEECAAFTGDYDDYSGTVDNDADYTEDGYFDKQNGWEKGLGNASNTGFEVYLSSEKHFGKKSVYVHNAFGPTKNCKIYSGKNYLFSAWVKVTEGTLKMVAEYRTGDANGNLNRPSDFAVKSVAADASKWQLVQLTVPGEALSGDNWWIRMWIGNDSANVKAFIDDIRFYPKDAIMTTFFYDYQLGVPLSFVDANNHAFYYKYDEFGRLVEKGVIKDN